MVALLVLGIGLAAWALVGIDRRSQQVARSGVDRGLGMSLDKALVSVSE